MKNKMNKKSQQVFSALMIIVLITAFFYLGFVTEPEEIEENKGAAITGMAIGMEEVIK